MKWLLRRNNLFADGKEIKRNKLMLIALVYVISIMFRFMNLYQFYSILFWPYDVNQIRNKFSFNQSFFYNSSGFEQDYR